MTDGIQEELKKFNLIGALKILLADKTTGGNIIWATDTYEAQGEQFYRDREITPELVTFLYGGVIKNRTEKDASRQSERTRKRAEVFTPLWICKKMIDYIDDDFYSTHKACHPECKEGSRENEEILHSVQNDRENVQNDNEGVRNDSICHPECNEGSRENEEILHSVQNDNEGIQNDRAIWQSYVTNRRLEITCGEAPYLVSRYDVSTGERIAIENRIGILDRKLRLISQNVDVQTEWFNWVVKAYQATYGYEFQGDSLLIARVNLLATFVEYYTEKWHELPGKADIKKIANIIAWNIWQMDGLNCRVPYCKTGTYQMSLFDNDCHPERSEGSRENEGILHYVQNDRENVQNDREGVRNDSICHPERSEGSQPLCHIKNWNNNYNVYFNNLSEGKGKMKFDYIIGNPPYQEKSRGANANDTPIYHFFYQNVLGISDVIELITPARFLFNAGGTPQDWNKQMLEDTHFKVLDYWADSSAVFSNVDIKGGVAVSYYDNAKDFGAIGVFSAYPELNSIREKVWNIATESLSEVITNRGIYRYSDKAYEEQPEAMKKTADRRIAPSSFERMPELFTKEKPEDENEYVQILGNVGATRVYRWFRRDYISDVPNLERYKVLVPKANGSGAIGEVLATPLIGSPLIGSPLIGFTETYIAIGETDNSSYAEATLKYVKTKFARTMLGILKVTQNNAKPTWKYVPLQDFTDKSDIDWSKSVAEIDRQLYAKYGLDEREISFIESKVKEMV